MASLADLLLPHPEAASEARSLQSDTSSQPTPGPENSHSPTSRLHAPQLWKSPLSPGSPSGPAPGGVGVPTPRPPPGPLPPTFCRSLWVQRKVSVKKQGEANPTPEQWLEPAGAPLLGAGCAYVMSRCLGGRRTFRTTHFTIHSMPSRTPLL